MVLLVLIELFFVLLVCRFLDNKEDIAKVRKCFAGLWSLDDSEIVSKAIERPELYVMKPQREGGGPIFLIFTLPFFLLFTIIHYPLVGTMSLNKALLLHFREQYIW